VIAVTGELDLATSPELEEQLLGALHADADVVILDLRELEFMDSTGLSVLVKAHRAAEEGARRLYLIKGPPQVQRLLSLTGVGERLTVLDSLDDLRDGD
jgi:anti-sigma B factor antagonist